MFQFDTPAPRRQRESPRFPYHSLGAWPREAGEADDPGDQPGSGYRAPMSADSRNVRYHGLPQDVASAQRVLQDPINLTERRPLHGLTGGAEKASGWSIGDIPRGVTNINLGSGDYQQDPGHVNTVQTIRVREALAPLPKGVSVNAMDIPSTLPEPGATLQPRPMQFSPALREASRHGNKRRKFIVNEALKMGLVRTSTDDGYSREARAIRQRDLRVVAHLAKQFNQRRPLSAKTAVGAMSLMRQGETRRTEVVPPSSSDMEYQNVIATEIPTPAFEDTVPGSNGTTFTDRMDTMAGNFLEKRPTTNPLGSMLLIDRATFDPRIRSLTTTPAIIRSNFGPPRV